MILFNFIFFNLCFLNYVSEIYSVSESIKRNKNTYKYIKHKLTTRQLHRDRNRQKYSNFYINSHDLVPKQSDHYSGITSSLNEIIDNDYAVEELNCSVSNNSKRCFIPLIMPPMYMPLTKSPRVFSVNKTDNKKLYQQKNNISTTVTPHLTTDFNLASIQDDNNYKIFPATGIEWESVPQDSTFQINSPVKSEAITVAYEEAGGIKQYLVPMIKIENKHTTQENTYLTIPKNDNYIYFNPTIDTLFKKPNYYHNSTSEILGISTALSDERYDSLLNHRLLHNYSLYSYPVAYDYTVQQNSQFWISMPENGTGNDELHNTNPNSKIQEGEEDNNTFPRQTRHASNEEQSDNPLNNLTPIFGSLMNSKRAKRQVAYQAYQFLPVNVPPDVYEPPVERFNIEIHYEQTQVTPILCSKAPEKLPSLTDYFPPKIDTDAGPPAAGGQQKSGQVYRQIEISDAMLGAGLDLAALFKGVTVRDVYVTVPITLKPSSAAPPKPTQRKRPKPPPTRKKIIRVTTSPTTTFRTDEYETDEYETETDEPEEYYSHGPDTDIISDQYYLGDGITTVRAPKRRKRSGLQARNREKSNNTFIYYKNPVHVKHRTGL